MQYGSIDLTLEAGDGGELLGLEAGVDTLDGELVGWVHGADADVDQDLALLSMSRVSAMAMAWGRGGRGGGKRGRHALAKEMSLVTTPMSGLA